MDKENDTIEHLVISGGGQSLLTFYGIVKESHEQKFWNISNIKSIYGTSAGAILALFLSLKCDWKTIDDYLVKRPWEKVFNIDLDSVVSIMNKFGFFDKQILHNIFEPLFAMNDISMNITMREFYEISNIDIHMYSTELNEFKTIDISHTTHPDWTIMNALYSSCNVPLMFSPHIVENENECYVDGGILCDFPLKYCLHHYDEKTIFAIKKINIQSSEKITKESNFFNYISCIFKRSINKILEQDEGEQIRNTVCVYDDMVSIEDILKVASSKEIRQQMIQKGVQLFQDFHNQNYGNLQ